MLTTMRSELVFVATIFVLIPAIWADIKDFIIENENDLNRFGLANTEQHHEDDLDSDWMPDSCGGGGDGAAGAYPYSDFMESDSGIGYDASQLDPRLLREIVRQMKNDPRFEHLWEHLSEDNILLQRNRLTDVDDEDSSNFYVDMEANFQGGNNYEIE